jgi:APA family basic amino acid/polyamine antiporter
MVGSLFSSDAWNSVTFAAAEVKNPVAQPAAGAACWARGSCSLLYILANFSYLSVLPFDGDADGATAVARGISTRRRTASAPAVPRRSSAPSGARSWRWRSSSRRSAATTG